VINPFFDTKNGVMELNFVPFFCVLIRREVIDEIGFLNPEMGVHYQSDWVYSDAVRNIARRRILHTAHSKVYHFAGRATQELRGHNPKVFEAMGVREDWRAVRRPSSAGE
jgi:GT2 family glycosyltransferase